jgi:hypothetical protein
MDAPAVEPSPQGNIADRYSKPERHQFDVKAEKKHPAARQAAPPSAS